MAITQLSHDTPGRAYYQSKRAAGKSHREALRCLKRRLYNTVYRRVVREAQPDTATGPWRTPRGRLRNPPGRLNLYHRPGGYHTVSTWAQLQQFWWLAIPEICPPGGDVEIDKIFSETKQS